MVADDGKTHLASPHGREMMAGVLVVTCRDDIVFVLVGCDFEQPTNDLGSDQWLIHRQGDHQLRSSETAGGVKAVQRTPTTTQIECDLTVEEPESVRSPVKNHHSLALRFEQRLHRAFHESRTLVDDQGFVLTETPAVASGEDESFDGHEDVGMPPGSS
jgi:hypothetical protein